MNNKRIDEISASITNNDKITKELIKSIMDNEDAIAKKIAVLDAEIELSGRALEIKLEEIRLNRTLENSEIELMDIYNEKGKTNNKTFDYLLNVYDKEYQPAMSSCFWAVYNAITDWATHAPSSAKNKIALSQRRSDKASEVIDRYLLAA